MRSTINYLRIFFVISLFFLITIEVMAKPKLHFAGLFILSQQNEQNDVNGFQYSQKYINEKHYQFFREKIINDLKQNKKLSFDFESEEFGKIADADSIAFGITFSDEKLLFLPLEKGLILDGWLMANVITFDFKKKVLIDFRPISIRILESFDDKNEAENWLKNTLYEKYIIQNNDFYNLIYEKLNQVQVDKKFNRFQVANISFSDNAENSFLNNINLKKDFEVFAAQSFEALINLYNPEVRLIPNGSRVGAMNDYDIGLTSQFSDKNSFPDLVLNIPKPDYVFNIKLRDIKFIRNPGKNEDIEILTYGVFNTIQVLEPLSGETRFEFDFRKKDLKQVKKIQGEINEDFKWGILQSEQFELFNVFAKEIKTKNFENLKLITGNKGIIKELDNLNKIFK